MNKFHNLETRPERVRWCCYPWECGSSTASPILNTVALLASVPYGTLRLPPRLFSVPVCQKDTQALDEVRVQHPPAEKRGVGCCLTSCVWRHRTSGRWLRTPGTCALYNSSLPFLSQSGDPLRGFLANGFDMAVTPQPLIHSHSQYLDVFLEWKSSVAKGKPSCHCYPGGW